MQAFDMPTHPKRWQDDLDRVVLRTVADTLWIRVGDMLLPSRVRSDETAGMRADGRLVAFAFMGDRLWGPGTIDEDVLAADETHRRRRRVERLVVVADAV